MPKNALNYIYFKRQNMKHSEINLLQARSLFHSNSAGNSTITYDDLLNNKTKILQDNKQKSGVYK